MSESRGIKKGSGHVAPGQSKTGVTDARLLFAVEGEDDSGIDREGEVPLISTCSYEHATAASVSQQAPAEAKSVGSIGRDKMPELV